MQHWTKDQKEKHQREWIASQEWVMTPPGQQTAAIRRTEDQAESTTSRTVQLTTAEPLQHVNLVLLCGLYSQKEEVADKEKEPWWKTSWRRSQWQLIERHPNTAARVMALRIALVATLDDGTRKAEQMVERILGGEEPEEEEINKALGEDAGMLPREYQVKI